MATLTETVKVRIGPKLSSKLERFSKKNEQTKGAVIRDALEAFIGKEEAGKN